jgi:hypothetical protein
MKNKKIIIIFSILIPLFLYSFIPVLAVETGLDATAGAAGVKNDLEISEIIGNIVYIILGFLGIFFIILLIYGGFMRMTAQGDAGKITKSTGIITSAIIGVLIILASYTITAFVLSRITASTGTNESSNYEAGHIEPINAPSYIPPIRELDN